jgi:hypothetical protein
MVESIQTEAQRATVTVSPRGIPLDLANWRIAGKSVNNCPIRPEHLAKLTGLIEDGKIR